MDDTESKGSDGVRVRVVNEAVTIEREGGLGWVVLTRPGQINAINDDIRNGVPQALRELDADPAVRVIAIRGAGPRGFCAGADIKEKRGPETAIEVRARMHGGRIAHLQRVEHAQDVELSFLRHIGRVGKQREGDMHGYGT